LTYDTEFARLHVPDMGNLLQDLSGVRLFHGRSIYMRIYTCHKKGALWLLS
jgi:hypothetical protein